LSFRKQIDAKLNAENFLSKAKNLVAGLFAPRATFAFAAV